MMTPSTPNPSPDAVGDVLTVVAQRWPSLDVGGYERVSGWAATHLATRPAEDVIQLVRAWTPRGLPAAAEVGLLIATAPPPAAALALGSPAPGTVNAGAELDEPIATAGTFHELAGDGDLEALDSAAVEEPKSDLEKGPRRATVFVSHELINMAACSDNAFAVWLLLGQVPGSHERKETCSNKWLTATLGWNHLREEDAERKLRTLRVELEKVGAVSTLTGPTAKHGYRRGWHRLMVPTVSHRGKWESVASENVATVLAEHGPRVLRTWLRYAAAAAGHGYTEVTMKDLAKTWGGVSLDTVKRHRKEALAAGLITAMSGSKTGQITGVMVPAEVIHRGGKSILPPGANLSGLRVQICPPKEDKRNTFKDPVVALATKETPQGASEELGRPRPPTGIEANPTPETHRRAAAVRDPFVARASKLIAQIPELLAVAPQQRGICRSTLTGLLRHQPRLDDDPVIVAALRTRFSDPATTTVGQTRHAVMVQEAIAGLIADTLAAPERPTSATQLAKSHTQPSARLRAVLDPNSGVTARAEAARARLLELAAEELVEPNWRDPDVDPYRWLVMFLASHANRSDTPSAAIAIVGRVARQWLVCVEHYAAHNAALALVASLTDQLDQQPTTHTTQEVTPW